MINRRLLRIKVVQVLYSYYQSDDKTINDAEKELLFSIEKTHELYYYFLQLMIEITRYAEHKIEQRKEKKLPSHEDLNPNTRFINNKIVALISENSDFKRFMNNKKLSWTNYPELIKKLFSEISNSDYYINYMQDESPSLEKDKQLWVKIFRKILFENEDLGNSLEEISIYWNDDAELILSMVQKTIKKYDAQQASEYKLLPLFKDIEDLDYVKLLMREAILNAKLYQEAISNTVKNWDSDRLAFMDTLIMQVSIAEAVAFKNIPVKVSINEFIEIAKSYSTQKSSVFINGVLDKVFKEFIEIGKIKKSGRGLME